MSGEQALWLSFAQAGAFQLALAYQWLSLETYESRNALVLMPVKCYHTLMICHMIGRRHVLTCLLVPKPTHTAQLGLNTKGHI